MELILQTVQARVNWCYIYVYHFIFSSSWAGTPEVAGLTPIQALEIVRGLKGLNIVGGDVVEVRRLESTCSGTKEREFVVLLSEVLYNSWDLDQESSLSEVVVVSDHDEGILSR